MTVDDRMGEASICVLICSSSGPWPMETSWTIPKANSQERAFQ